MAKTVHITGDSAEELIVPIDWTDALLTSVTVSSVAVTHYPPYGAAASPTATVTTPQSFTKIPAGLVVGVHEFKNVATTSNSDLSPVVLIVVRVDK